MKNLDPSRIRKQLAELCLRRERLEKKLLARQRSMIAACLVVRLELAGGKLRKTPAFYLSRKLKGKTKLTYVRKNQLAAVRQGADRWREFASTLAEWVKLIALMEKLFRDLGKAQT
ncbi:MAG: hypothetical protein ABIG69_01830 [Bacteroidota bacterium]